ncbi:glycosyl transferase family 1 [Tardiphaga robiniae]|uniref:Glycosyl transferase family 1 n=2 Tax=Tardiphaga robiniae TaxID=943830 RepID=A0A163XA67_9BRAD|nr:glycosyl transferase family 1 [Tardiphaga robiniae]
MHIGFDISQTGSGKAGCGYFTHAMITAMLARAPQHRYALYPSFGDFFLDAKMPATSPYQGPNVHYGQRHVTMDGTRGYWSQSNLEAVLGNPDIIHSNNFWTPLQISSSRLIYTLYDAGFVVDPTWTTEGNRIGCFDGIFRAAVAADWVVAISEYTRSHYLKTFPHFPSERVRVVYPCSRFTDCEQQGTAPKSLKDLDAKAFWLSVGTIEPRKNQRMLMLAYKRYLDAGGRPMPLVLAGGKGWLMEDFKDYVAELGLSDQVILTGYVSDEELIWLYRNCYASLYPSVFEGFGLPVLEGMQFGAATMCSNTTSMPEVAGDAAILLSPDAPDAWTRNMLELALDEAKRQQLSMAGQQRARQFDWKRSAEAMLEIYDLALRSPKRSNMANTTSPKSGHAQLENHD